MDIVNIAWALIGALTAMVAALVCVCCYADYCKAQTGERQNRATVQEALQKGETMSTKAKIVTTVLLLILVVTATMPEAAEANTVHTKNSSVGKELRKAAQKHQKTKTVYTKKQVDINKIGYRYIYSRSNDEKKVYKEKQNWKNDYMYYGMLKQATAKGYQITEGGDKYYKYIVTYAYCVGKEKNKYINNRCKKAAELVKGKSQRGKVNAICKWIAKNMEYEVTNKPTIYEALKKGRGQCKHYSLIFYKIAKDAGLNVRIVTGEAGIIDRDKHMWCIVKIGKKWYNVDPTWADGGDDIKTRWILKGSDSIMFKTTHTLDKQFTEKTFTKSHPMADG